MRIELTDIEPIVAGYDFEVRIVYPAEFWTAEQMGSGRLVAHFRTDISGPLCFEADTEDGTLEQDDDERQITLKLPASATASMFGRRGVVLFDFARLDDDGARRAIPGRFTWPVNQTVTRNVQ